MTDDLTPRTINRDNKETRIDKINNKVDNGLDKILDELEIIGSDLEACMEIMRDRLISSTDASFPIALARLSEIRVDVVKKKLDVIKTLVNDKAIEASVKKRSHQSELESILSGAMLGNILGAKITGGNLSNNITETIIDITPESTPNNTLEDSVDNMIKDSKEK